MGRAFGFLFVAFLAFVFGNAVTAVVCVTIASQILGYGSTVDETAMQMNQQEYSQWYSKNVTPPITWISVAGGLTCAVLAMIVQFIPAKK